MNYFYIELSGTNQEVTARQRILEAGIDGVRFDHAYGMSLSNELDDNCDYFVFAATEMDREALRELLAQKGLPISAVYKTSGDEKTIRGDTIADRFKVSTDTKPILSVL